MFHRLFKVRKAAPIKSKSCEENDGNNYGLKPQQKEGKGFSTSHLQTSQHLNKKSHSEGSSPLDTSGEILDIDDIEIDDKDPPKDGTIKPNHKKFLRQAKKIMRVAAHTGKDKLRKPDLNKINSHPGDMKNQAQKSDGELSPVCSHRTINEVKAAYKSGKDHSVMGTASRIRDKLIQQRHKLGEIERKTTDMQEGAQRFHKVAEELYKAIEEKNKQKFF